jgi:hypothetical protein
MSQPDTLPAQTSLIQILVFIVTTASISLNMNNTWEQVRNLLDGVFG